MIEWRKVRGYTNYEVSNTGQVRSWHKHKCHECFVSVSSVKVISQWESKRSDGNTDMRVSLYKKGKKRNFRVHRLVAKAFLPNPNRFREVDHLNGNTHYNHTKNLEWVNRIENERRKRKRMQAKHG